MLALDILNIIPIRPYAEVLSTECIDLIFSCLENLPEAFFFFFLLQKMSLVPWDFQSWGVCKRVHESCQSKTTSCNVAPHMPNSSGLLLTAWQANHNSVRPNPRPTCRRWHFFFRQVAWLMPAFLKLVPATGSSIGAVDNTSSWQQIGWLQLVKISHLLAFAGARKWENWFIYGSGALRMKVGRLQKCSLVIIFGSMNRFVLLLQFSLDTLSL